MPYNSLTQIRAANARIGNNFFSKETMAFFDSRICEGVYGGVYFITSERFENSKGRGPRRYTIRIANEDGTISMVGSFLEHNTEQDAICVINSLLSDAEDAAADLA
tara:strand:- start:1055 stop:1372 length:318 start_codon:yes stop_codon:yes gene_type:complete